MASAIGNLTKTTIMAHKELFLQELKEHIVPLLAEFPDPYIVTYQAIEADVQTILQHPTHHYGATRGSNAYRTTAAAVLLGAYRPPVSFDRLAQLLFGACYCPRKMAVAHWIQDAYRTRIRSEEPIKLLVMGEQKAVDLFHETLQIPFWPLAIGGADAPDILEKILRRTNHKVRKALLTELRRNHTVDISAFARAHTNREVSKVHRAVRGILTKDPRLEGHIVVDETTVRLIDKPVPQRSERSARLARNV